MTISETLARMDERGSIQEAEIDKLDPNSPTFLTERNEILARFHAADIIGTFDTETNNVSKNQAARDTSIQRLVYDTMETKLNSASLLNKTVQIEKIVSDIRRYVIVSVGLLILISINIVL